MKGEIIYSSEHIVLTRRVDGFYIESFKPGMMLDQFNKVMEKHPEIRITSFVAIRNALAVAPVHPVKFGEAKERVTVEVSPDEMRACVTLCVRDEELQGDMRKQIVQEVLDTLRIQGVVFGIKTDLLAGALCNQKQILVAEGIAPVPGEDSIVTMYEMKEAKPTIQENGQVNHYEMNLINMVKEGDWLGERLEPGAGIPGTSVRGREISAAEGRRLPLVYDASSVREVQEGQKTVLYATRRGAVHYEGDRISVSNHLEINSNVDFKTGNIVFDGYLTVKGTIEDNFSISADMDIEILGDYGVGSVKDIVSREGSIYIKGGIAGKNRAVIKSKKDIFTKYVADATIICEGSVHIGFYCLNSNIIAREVILDSPRGQIIGGSIQAHVKVVSSVIGNSGEKRTLITVKGFDREEMKVRLDRIQDYIEQYKGALAKAKLELSMQQTQQGRGQSGEDKARDAFIQIKNNLKLMEEERKITLNALRTHGEGAVTVLKRIYPNTRIEIKKTSKEIQKELLGTTFYVYNGEIKET